MTRVLFFATVGIHAGTPVSNFESISPMNKEKIQAALMIIAVVGAVAYIQRKIFAIPVIGEYLPK